MRHFVHGPDGQKYGPADLAMLQQWRDEGRLTAENMLEPEVGGTPFPAKDMPGLFVQQLDKNPYEQSALSYADYPYQQSINPQANTFAIWAGILAVLSVFCCWCFLGPASIYFALKAKSLGHPNGSKLVTFSIVCLVFGGIIAVALTIDRIQNGGLGDLFK